ncbi:hypothetical protein G9A89_000693 [Geosiphon pyriformis]|nr:hypothetical protein G9A89_000693 [Geosiphon pyriformis]
MIGPWWLSSQPPHPPPCQLSTLYTLYCPNSRFEWMPTPSAASFDDLYSGYLWLAIPQCLWLDPLTHDYPGSFQIPLAAFALVESMYLFILPVPTEIVIHFGSSWWYGYPPSPSRNYRMYQPLPETVGGVIPPIYDDTLCGLGWGSRV